VPDQSVVKVSYQRRLHSEDLITALENSDIDTAHRAMISLLTTKFSHCRYEREVRAFLSLDTPDPVSGLYFLDFGENLVLKEVIVGHSSNINRAELSDTLGNIRGQVECRKARLAFRSFNVVRQGDGALWA